MRNWDARCSNLEAIYQAERRAICVLSSAARFVSAGTFHPALNSNHTPLSPARSTIHWFLRTASDTATRHSHPTRNTHPLSRALAVCVECSRVRSEFSRGGSPATSVCVAGKVAVCARFSAQGSTCVPGYGRVCAQLSAPHGSPCATGLTCTQNMSGNMLGSTNSSRTTFRSPAVASSAYADGPPRAWTADIGDPVSEGGMRCHIRKLN